MLVRHDREEGRRHWGKEEKKDRERQRYKGNVCVLEPVGFFQKEKNNDLNLIKEEKVGNRGKIRSKRQNGVGGKTLA